MIPAGKDWLDLLSALLTPTVAILGLSIAAAQWRLNKVRLRHELFEKRYAKFEALRRFVGTVVQYGAVKEDERRIFLTETAGSAFLFGKDVPQYLRQVHDKAIKLQYVLKRLEASDLSEDQRSKLADEDEELVRWFAEQFDQMELVLGAYLALGTK